MAALILGLLVASAKSSYDAQGDELTQLSANIVLLDRVIAHYGPETRETRDMLRDAAVQIGDRIWPREHSGPSGLDPRSTSAEVLFDKIQQLSPKDNTQRSLRAQALSIAIGVAQTRW